MEVVVIDHFKKLEPSTTPMTQLHYHLSDESEKDASTIATHINIILCLHRLYEDRKRVVESV